MGDRKFTLFELHTHGDTQLGPKQMGGETDSAESTDIEEPTTPDREASAVEESGGRGGALKALLGVVVTLGILAAGAKAVGRLLGGDEEFPPAIELDEDAPEAPAE